MFGSHNNNRLFLAILLGVFMASGCSGHSVKYGANSEGDGMASSEGEMSGSGDNTYSVTGRNPDGTPIFGGTVNGNASPRPGQQGVEGSSSDGRTTAVTDGTSSVPGSAANYGQQYGGVDGSGPNHGAVTGFGSGSANPSNPDPEAWANAYLRGGNSSQEFYGDPSKTGSSSPSGSGELAHYGQNYEGVPGSGPNYGAVDGFGHGSASSMEANPENWARAYLNENGGPRPEYVNPDMSIVQAKAQQPSHSMGKDGESGGPLPINISGGPEGHVQDIYFAFDSWSISPEGARYLEEDARWLHANPEKALTIEGHCDQRGTQDYNLVLGQKRAEAARDYLINLGIQAHRIKIVSYGKERPFCQNDNEACFQENRRNHMVVRVNQS